MLNGLSQFVAWKALLKYELQQCIRVSVREARDRVTEFDRCNSITRKLQIDVSPRNHPFRRNHKGKISIGQTKMSLGPKRTVLRTPSATTSTPADDRVIIRPVYAPTSPFPPNIPILYLSSTQWKESQVVMCKNNQKFWNELRAVIAGESIWYERLAGKGCLGSIGGGHIRKGLLQQSLFTECNLWEACVGMQSTL